MRTFTMKRLSYYREEIAGSRTSPKRVFCSWCGREISHNRGDHEICIGDDNEIYCCGCAENIGKIVFVDRDPWDYPDEDDEDTDDEDWHE